jgi:hypothetical protein
MSDDEKDRLGDKLRDKQRAEEDRYFAQQEREKLAKLRNQAAPEAHAVAPGRCPRDGTNLIERNHLGVTLDDCPKCGGLWLDKGELERVFERKDEGWEQRWLRSVLSGPQR